MVHKANSVHQHQTTLRCVWLPTHTGTNAPLAATWIPLSRCSTNREVTGGCPCSRRRHSSAAPVPGCAGGVRRAVVRTLSKPCSVRRSRSAISSSLKPSSELSTQTMPSYRDTSKCGCNSF